MSEADNIRIRHILDAAREAVAFAKGRSRADLDSDRKLSLSLVRLLEIIGEAEKRRRAFRRNFATLTLICPGRV